MRLLLLGGTSEARDLAARLVDDRDSDIEVTMDESLESVIEFEDASGLRRVRLPRVTVTRR